MFGCVHICVFILAALRAYLREGNCHLQQTSWGWRSAAPSHGVSGLRHSATRYEAMVHAWINTVGRFLHFISCHCWWADLRNIQNFCRWADTARHTFEPLLYERVSQCWQQWPSTAQLSEASHYYESILIRSSWRDSLQNFAYPRREFSYSKVQAQFNQNGKRV